jgi:hypothetical protein
MTLSILQSEPTAARRRVYFQAVDASDGITAETGLTGTAYISKNGGSPAASTNSIVEIDSTNMPGRYYLELTAAEVDTLGTIEVRYKAAACAEVVVRAVVVATDPYVDLSDKVEDWVWDALVADHTAAGTMGEAMEKLSLEDFTLAVQVADEVWERATSAHITAGTFGKAVKDILADTETDGVALSTATMQAIADELLKRDWTAVSGEAARSVLNALRFLRNKWSVSGGTLTVYKENDTAPAWTAASTPDAGADPVVEVDPS